MLTDLPDIISCRVEPPIADHCVVITELTLPALNVQTCVRQCWLYKSADWRSIKRELRNGDWRWIDTCSPEEAVLRLNPMLLALMARFIPRHTMRHKFSHPWLDETSLRLVARKAATAGSADFPMAARECSEGLLSAFNRYTGRTRQRLRAFRRGSRKWWCLSKELLDKSCKLSSAPLRAPSGRWV